MKQLILCSIATIVILAGGLWLLFMWYQPNINSIFNNKPIITTWKYQGHDMLLYKYKNSYSICHSPTCKKCYQIFD